MQIARTETYFERMERTKKSIQSFHENLKLSIDSLFMDADGTVKEDFGFKDYSGSHHVKAHPEIDKLMRENYEKEFQRENVQGKKEVIVKFDDY